VTGLIIDDIVDPP